MPNKQKASDSSFWIISMVITRGGATTFHSSTSFTWAFTLAPTSISLKVYVKQVSWTRMLRCFWLAQGLAKCITPGHRSQLSLLTNCIPRWLPVVFTLTHNHLLPDQQDFHSSHQRTQDTKVSGTPLPPREQSQSRTAPARHCSFQCPQLPTRGASAGVTGSKAHAAPRTQSALQGR